MDIKMKWRYHYAVQNGMRLFFGYSTGLLLVGKVKRLKRHVQYASSVLILLQTMLLEKLKSCLQQRLPVFGRGKAFKVLVLHDQKLLGTAQLLVCRHVVFVLGELVLSSSDVESRYLDLGQ